MHRTTTRLIRGKTARQSAPWCGSGTNYLERDLAAPPLKKSRSIESVPLRTGEWVTTLVLTLPYSYN